MRFDCAAVRGHDDAVASEVIFHLAIASDWSRDASRDYVTSTLGRELADIGFIHCSFASQVQRIADLVYKSRDDVVLLEIHPDRLRAPLKVETGDDGEEFPHIYGPLNRDAVIRVTRLGLRDDGTLDVASVVKHP
jgi:uncharacterized protein (DUF952 family)